MLGYRRSAGRPAVPPSIRDPVGWPAGFLRRRLAAAALTHRTAYEIRDGFPDWFLGGRDISNLGLSVSGWLDLRLSDAGLCLFVCRTGRRRRRLANRWAGSSLSCAGSVGGWPTDSEVAPQTRRSPGSSASSAVRHRRPGASVTDSESELRFQIWAERFPVLNSLSQNAGELSLEKLESGGCCFSLVLLGFPLLFNAGGSVSIAGGSFWRAAAAVSAGCCLVSFVFQCRGLWFQCRLANLTSKTDQK